MDGDLGPPPGWYPDPRLAGTQRYWDGMGWTGHVAAARPPVSMSEGPSGPLIGIGWTMTLFFPIVGLILGIVVVSKGSNQGVGMIIGSIIVLSLWLTLNGY